MSADKISLGQMPVEKMSVGEMTVDVNDSSLNKCR